MKNCENSFFSFIDVTFDFINHVNSFCTSNVCLIDVLTNQKITIYNNVEKGRVFLKTVYDSLEKGSISFYVKDQLKTFKFQPIDFKIEKIPDLAVCEYLEEFSIQYKDLLTTSKEEFDYFKTRKEEFINMRTKIVEFPTIFDVPKEDKLRYIESYHRLILSFILFRPLQQLDVVHSLLHLDTFYNRENQFTYSFWAPLLFAQVEIMEEELNNYITLPRLLNKSVFISTVKELFQFNLLNEQDKLSIVSLDEQKGLVMSSIDENTFEFNKKEKTYEEKKMVLPPFSNSQFLDYAYLSLLKKKYKYENVIKVAVIGNVMPSVIESLYEILIKETRKNDIKKDIVLEVYTNVALKFSSKYDNIIVPIVNNQVLKSKSILNQVIEENDFLFVFDSKDLYANQWIRKSAIESVEWLKNTFARLDFFNDRKYAFYYLEYMLFFVSSFFDKNGQYTIQQEFGNELFHFMTENAKNKNTSLFLFLNSCILENHMHMLDTSPICKGMHYIEDKENGINEYFMVDYLKKPEINSKKKLLQFSLGEFYSFIFSNDEYFKKFMNDNKDFLNVIVSLDYSDYRQLTWYYNSVENLDRNLIFKFLQEKFIPCFQPNLKMNHLIGKFFYNISSNYNDLLFTHLFLEKKVWKNWDEMTISKDPKPIFDIFPYFYHKWLYYRVLQDCDYGSYSERDVQISVLLNKLEEQNTKKIKQFYNNLLRTCTQMQYEEGLVRKLKRITDGAID